MRLQSQGNQVGVGERRDDKVTAFEKAYFFNERGESGFCLCRHNDRSGGALRQGQCGLGGGGEISEGGHFRCGDIPRGNLGRGQDGLPVLAKRDLRLTLAG
ncbi:MAG: hypothetical protein LBO00_01155 [Zoogloeaceae bacterium]|jgi:hypothetical protein|nr:hypothetical protein [Zoogloeaceae bacterium]